MRKPLSGPPRDVSTTDQPPVRVRGDLLTHNLLIYQRPLYLLWVVGVALGLCGWVEGTLTWPELRQRLIAQESAITNWAFTYQQEVVVGGAIPAQAPERTQGEAPISRQRVRGKAVIQRPGFLWLRQTAPEEEQIVSDGQRLWMYTPRFQQVLVSSWTVAVQRMPFLTALAGWGQALSELERRYRVSLEPAGNHLHVLRCTPRDPQETTVLRFWLADTDLLPRRTEIHGEGVRIVTEFRDLETNRPVKERLFRFIVPPGVQVIDE